MHPLDYVMTFGSRDTPARDARCKILYIFFLGLLALGLGSCSNPDITTDAVGALGDFVFVGSAESNVRQNAVIDRGYVVPHSNTPQPIPPKLIVGMGYVFHYDGTIDDEELALRILPKRLSQRGLKVAKVPSANDLMYIYAGGPLFAIPFQQGTHEGMIYNQLDQLHFKDRRVFNGEIYILTYFK